MYLARNELFYPTLSNAGMV